MNEAHNFVAPILVMKLLILTYDEENNFQNYI